MTLCVVRRNRGLILHWQMGEIMAKIGLVLWWVLIISFRILLELGKKHRSFATLIFAWFGCLKSPKSLETRRFSGYCNFSYLPSNSVKFGFGNLTRNQVVLTGSWVRIPPAPPRGNTGPAVGWCCPFGVQPRRQERRDCVQKVQAGNPHFYHSSQQDLTLRGYTNTIGINQQQLHNFDFCGI